MNNPKELNAIDPDWGSILAASSRHGRLQTCQALLQKDVVDVNAIGGLYHTALISACAWGKKEVAKLLLDHGARIDVSSRGRYGTAVFCVLALEYPDLYALLLAKAPSLRFDIETYRARLKEPAEKNCLYVVEIRGANDYFYGAGLLAKVNFDDEIQIRVVFAWVEYEVLSDMGSLKSILLNAHYLRDRVVNHLLGSKVNPGPIKKWFRRRGRRADIVTDSITRHDTQTNYDFQVDVETFERYKDLFMSLRMAGIDIESPYVKY